MIHEKLIRVVYVYGGDGQVRMLIKF